MTALLERLRPNERRGSKPRCHSLTQGSPDEVSARLTALAAPFATISRNDHWMPQGFEQIAEAQLHRAPRLLDPAISTELASWWFATIGRKAKTPNFDIASTCTIDGSAGLVLVEAKAHDEELYKETIGKRLKVDRSQRVSKNGKANHDKIGLALAAAREGLEHSTSHQWGISRDSCYQMSNRFAWAWKLTELGLPVVLIYLGFLNANEMADKGKPIFDQDHWERLVKSHSEKLMASEVWGRKWTCNGHPFIALIRSLQWPLAPTLGT